ncbi:DUF3152 domain-containing protein [Brachybacterium saurashtrense]|uniref:DUF3152 domain-containing protein n=1 Tax=Brachybacterium saurashtrense TaxID=556288 RepID=UPI000F8DD643|nr:DUF3152 domain-containing protein [Brachybacterium saurashtrense]
MPHPTPSRPALRLTRRGRLVRSVLVLVLAVLLLLAMVALVRAVRGGPDAAAAPADATAAGPEGDDGSAGDAPDADEAASPSPTPETEGEVDGAAADGEIERSGTVGEGTWTVAAPVDAPTGEAGADADGEDGSDGQEERPSARTYAVRVEDGIGIDADEAATEIAAVLADERGWQDREDVVFQQVASPEEAEFTISLASPPTVDEMCLPARTGGLWSCRIGPDVALNSDRWLLATPTYEDLAEYRAYMVNHEVGHFLGFGHADCGGEGRRAPVMLQQSIDLQGCVPNAWPATEEA